MSENNNGNGNGNKKNFLQVVRDYWQIILFIGGVIATLAVQHYTVDDTKRRVDSIEQKVDWVNEKVSNIEADIGYIRGRMEK